MLDTLEKRYFHNNIPSFHISTISDVTWLTIIFFHVASKESKIWITLGYILFLISALASALWIDGFFVNMNTFSRIIGNSFLVGLALRQIIQMTRHDYLLPPEKNPYFIFCTMVITYYACSLLVIISQALPRYTQFYSLEFHLTESDFTYFPLIPYPFLRAIQLGLLLHLITLFPMGVTPRRALPQWLRFRLGWRPPSKTWTYRVLPPHLVG